MACSVSSSSEKKIMAYDHSRRKGNNKNRRRSTPYSDSKRRDRHHSSRHGSGKGDNRDYSSKQRKSNTVTASSVDGFIDSDIDDFDISERDEINNLNPCHVDSRLR